MNMFRKGSILLPMCVMASLALHAALIARISGMEVLGLSGLLAQKVFIANIVTEGPDSTLSAVALKKSAAFMRMKKIFDTATKDRQPAGNNDYSYTEKENAEREDAAETEERIADSGAAAPAPEERKEDLKAAEITSEEIPEVRSDSATPAVAEVKKPLPSLLNSSREKFSYDIYWLGMFVGRAVLEAVNDNGNIKITSQVHSAPFVSAFYRVEDYAESTLINGAPANFRIKQREGRYRSDKETVFDPETGRVTFFNYLKGTKDEHPAADKPLWDVISGFYYLRTRDFEVGKNLSVDIFDSNKILKADVNVLRKEKIKVSPKGEVDAVIVKPVLKSDGLFQNKGEILIWLTDDKNRIPVRVETKVPIGTVVAELKQVETQ